MTHFGRIFFLARDLEVLKSISISLGVDVSDQCTMCILGSMFSFQLNKQLVHLYFILYNLLRP